jgi:head-tail adaptor
MQTAPQQPADPSTSPSASPQPAEHDAARAALRDLVTLCAECTAKEAEIAQTHQAEVEQADKELARFRSNFEMRFKALRDEIQQKSQVRIDEINRQFQAELAELKASDTHRRRMVVDDFERVNGDVQNKVQQAVWLAESVYEAAQNGLKEESK